MINEYTVTVSSDLGMGAHEFTVRTISEGLLIAADFAVNEFEGCAMYKIQLGSVTMAASELDQ